MNVVFISPAFPPQYKKFCAALHKRGVNVFGIGDVPHHELEDELRAALNEYVYEPKLDTYDAAYRAVAYLAWRHGRIDRIESNNEHWLSLDARLRDDFNVPGPRPTELQTWRTKSGMASVYSAIGVPQPESALYSSREQVLQFAKTYGFPLVLKPNQGVGAQATYKASNDAELAGILERPLNGYLVQPFITGRIVSYDGVADANGRIVFETSHEYSSGIMEVVNGRLDFCYWSRRTIPPQLLEYGRRTVAGFGIKERFFHAEFFELADGTHRALEINVRPPGGFTTDMMNYTADIDVYDLWARVLTGEDLSGFTWTPKYHVMHASRRSGRAYAHTHEEIRARVGDRFLWWRMMPAAFAMGMGEEVFMLRGEDLAELQDDVAFIQQTRA